MAKNHWDYIIVGSGIDACLKALELQRRGLKGVLLSEDDQPGGIYRGLRQNESTFESHLSFLPQSERADLVVQRICAELPHVHFNQLEVGPLTFQNGQVQPFLGFGATENEAVDLYSLMTPAKQWVCSVPLHEVIQALITKWAGDVRTLSTVTQLELTPQPQVIVNGTDTLTSSHIYFFESPLKLAKLFLKAQSPLPKALVTKLSKTQLWTAVSLVYQHSSTLTESPALHVLFGAKELPTVGRFISENSQSTSQWLCLVGPEIAADSELLGSTLREMKKQIKRMYPTFFEAVLKENIIISPDSYGSVNTQLLENDTFPKVAGLSLGGRGFTNGCGLEGDLLSLTLASPLQIEEGAPQLTDSV